MCVYVYTCMCMQSHIHMCIYVCGITRSYNSQGYDVIREMDKEFIESLNRDRGECPDAILYIGKDFLKLFLVLVFSLFLKNISRFFREILQICTGKFNARTCRWGRMISSTKKASNTLNFSWKREWQTIREESNVFLTRIFLMIISSRNYHRNSTEIKKRDCLSWSKHDDVTKNSTLILRIFRSLLKNTESAMLHYHKSQESIRRIRATARKLTKYQSLQLHHRLNYVLLYSLKWTSKRALRIFCFWQRLGMR